MNDAENKIETHDSYGLVGFSRVTGNPGSLFGSSINHSSFIRLRVSRAAREWSLSRFWYRDREQLIELDLSAAQFADLLTSMNVGVGIPCTLKYVGMKKMAECPSYDQRTKHEDDFKARSQEITEQARKLCDAAKAILEKKTILKPDRDALLDLIFRIRQDITENINFVHSSFNEAMDKTVTECKAEVEAFVNNKVISLGMESLRGKLGGGELNSQAMLEGVAVAHE